MIKRFLFAVVVLFPLSSVSAQGMIKSPEREHPFLFFSEEDIPSIRKRMNKEPFASRWELLIKNADYIVDEPIQKVQLGKKPGIDESLSPSRWYLGNAGTTAFAYVITGKEKYAQRAVKEALYAAGRPQKFWTTPKDYNKGASLETATLSLACALVYDWCYDFLNESQKEKLKSAILEKGIDQYLISLEGNKPGQYSKSGGDRKDWWVNNFTTNWAGVVHGGMGTAALLFYHEDERARRSVQAARKYIPRFMDHVFLKDGGGHEGIMYADYGREWGLYFVAADSRFRGIDKQLFKELNQKLAGYWEIYMQGTDNKYANFNDMSEGALSNVWSEYYAQNHYDKQLYRNIEGKRDRAPSGPNSVMSAFFESIVPGGDSLLLWAADNGGTRYCWRGACPFYFLWRRGEATSQIFKKRPELQDAVLFREAGHAIVRSSNMWLAYNGGWISDKSHYNCDLGTFVLVTDKERLVNDPGYGYNHAKMHSTITINGKDQIRGREGEYLHFGSGKSFHYFATDLTRAYDKKHLNQFIRHVIMVKDSYIILFDEVDLQKPGDIAWRLQTRAGAKVYNKQDAAVNGTDTKLYVLDATPGKIHTSVQDWGKQKNKMHAVTKKPAQRVTENLFVTILYPAGHNKDEQKRKPKASFQEGKLIVEGSNGNKEFIIFRKGESRWHLSKVNNEDARYIPPGDERTIEPYRDKHSDGINAANLPRWFFPEDK